MRRPGTWRSHPDSPRLILRPGERTIELWTEAVGTPPAVYGERWRPLDRRLLRSFEPGRSKLAAGLAEGWRGPLPTPGERWLYLGAASGTTASHVADLVGPSGRVYAIERSPRPFARLLTVATRWPNLLPVLGDARDPRGYFDLVPEVDGLYADVAQPDQVEIVRANAELYLHGAGSAVLVALKTASMGRTLGPRAHLERAERELGATARLEPSVRLDPYHRAHFLLGGRVGGGARRPAVPRARPRRARRPVRRPR